MRLTELVKRRGLAIFLVLFMASLSSCEVFKTIYGTGNQDSNKTGIEGIVFKPDKSATTLIQPSEEEKTDSKKTPAVIIAEETEMVRLKPQADDPDRDKLIFTYTTPLDENGEWQTSYGDAGEYTVTVTVSDGKATDSQDILIIVNKKEESPEIILTEPSEAAIALNEAESATFSITAEDKNNDALSYTWKLDGAVISTDEVYTYESTYDDAGPHTVKAEVSDGASSVNKIWSVTVTNVNRKPVLEELKDIAVKETEIATISVFASDADGDKLEFSIADPRFEQVGDNEFEWKTDYDSEGEYKVEVSISDGVDTASKEITVKVENLNRAPKLVGYEKT